MSNTTAAPKSICFMFLKAFLATGGIEKVNRVILKSLWDMEKEGQAKVSALSPYAIGTDPHYFPAEKLNGYKGNKLRFMMDLLWRPYPFDTMLVGHINLAPAVCILKKRYPSLKIILIVHGIEVWRKLKGSKRWLLQHADQIISVSEFTKGKLKNLNGINPEKVAVLPNCLDPFFKIPENLEKPAYLLKQYQLRPDQKVILTVARLNAHEGYKGYDKVLQCMPALIEQFPDVQYILAGKYDHPERARLETIIQQLGIEKNVTIPGFIADENLTDHYCLADVFVMPSKKEGFGIVFIEAMACGTPAIGGNTDGSPEALRPGTLGYVVNPEDLQAISATIATVLNTSQSGTQLQQKTADCYNYPQYNKQFSQITAA
jgi:glycosyltransferase involved in cell wall biosynthesis